MAAHEGTTHAGTPHSILLLFVVLGLGIVIGSGVAVRRRLISGRLGILGAFAGFGIGGFGGIGLVEIQVVAATGPQLTEWYPIASLVVGSMVMLGSQVLGMIYWPRKPRYLGLGILLGVWIMYPALLPNQGVLHPLGYLLVPAIPLSIGYILWHDARGVLRTVVSQRFPRAVGMISAVLFSVFFAFSAGTLSINPDTSAGMRTEGFVTTLPVSGPLVYWPAVEFYLPSIPLAGMVSLGTLLLFGLLGGLIGLNAAVVAVQWDGADDTASTRALAGTLTTTGATACCCCAPAMYGITSAIFGAAATPVYWAFMDPSSPVGGLFFAASVLLLTGSLLRATGSRGTRVNCEVPATSS
ncbi:hypothetical protein [Halorussus sp. AFM4]|uniref:hypothetical protein n=1 Tax=Halorussus sp. AFM4 TaxID=3421651 RepID=UPI003EBEE5B8